MVHRLVRWALDNPLIVIAGVATLIAIGCYSIIHVNVEAYPDPAPAIVEVIAKYPGASAEEVERQVTIPLEVAMVGMPGLTYTRSKSLFGLSHLRNQFDYGVDFHRARQELINRLQFVEGLPAGIAAQISPQSPTGEILRYTLQGPDDENGDPIYTLNDLKSLQDWGLLRQFRRIPRIIDTVSSGGTVKRYEVHPDPEMLMRYGITLKQLQATIAQSNANVGGDYLVHGDNLVNVRSVGLIGGGLDPARAPLILTRKDPIAAAHYLRSEEARRVRQIRELVITSINNAPIRIADVVDGGPTRYLDELGKQGVVVGNHPRLGRISLTRPKVDEQGKSVQNELGETEWIDEEEKVQGIVLMRKGEASLPALRDVKQEIDRLNSDPSSLLPGVKVIPYYDRTELINVTTHTVEENLLVGMVLVSMILFMFLANVRCAVIVAINVPLALMVAFSILYLRGKSANLLSIGAVDFGIIVDSSVIIVENIYRHLSTGVHAELPLKDRILRACGEVERGLFFTTAVMVCAFLPLFTMRGPEGQIFGPMADTYAFALAGALLLALTFAPVLCLLLLKDLKPVNDNFIVRWLLASYLRRLEWCLNHRISTLGFLTVLAGITIAMLPTMGREFMPELEEGNLYVRGTFPINVSPDAAAATSDKARQILRRFPEVRVVVSQNGRPDDGTDPTGFYNLEFFVPLKPPTDWPISEEQTGWKSLFGSKRSRTKAELVTAMDTALSRELVGANWNFSQNIRDNVMESLSGVKGDNSVKIFGPDLDVLEQLAGQVMHRLSSVQGITGVGVFRVKGQPNLEIPIDPEKCNYWGISVDDVNDVVKTAVGGKPFTQMIEGERHFDISLRWPAHLRSSEEDILNIPVDVFNNRVTEIADTSESRSKGMTSLSPLGNSGPSPAIGGTRFSAPVRPLAQSPRRRIRDLVTPLNDEGHFDSKNGRFIRPGASTIYREQGNRMIAVKFSVRGRDLAGAVDEAQARTFDLFQSPYRSVWSGEFDQMKEAEGRLMVMIPVSLLLVFALLYLAFRSFLDTFAVLANVVALSMGGIWALLLTHTHFSISAAVGFISIFGVAIMDGVLLISYFNQLRYEGMPLHEAILQGAAKRVRPVMMTALTAILGLLPAALSTKIGAQTQQPLAIVVVGGMIMTLLLTRYLMPVLYSFYGGRTPSEHAGGISH